MRQGDVSRPAEREGERPLLSVSTGKPRSFSPAARQRSRLVPEIVLARRIVDDPLRESDAPAGGAAAADERYVPAPVAPVLLRLRQPPHRPLETTPVAVPVPCQ